MIAFFFLYLFLFHNDFPIPDSKLTNEINYPSLKFLLKLTFS